MVRTFYNENKQILHKGSFIPLDKYYIKEVLYHWKKSIRLSFSALEPTEEFQNYKMMY